MQYQRVHPPFCWGGEGHWISYQIFKSVCVCGKGGGFTGLQDLTFERGVAGKEGVTFFSGGLQFLQKNTKIWNI